MNMSGCGYERRTRNNVNCRSGIGAGNSINCISERRIRNNRIRRRKEMQKNFLLAVLTICLVITFSFSVSSFLSNAKADNNNVSYKYYKSITISNGDTLWSIAREYMDSEHYDSIKDYIKEVKQINCLNSDTISYGENIVVPYYSNKYVG